MRRIGLALVVGATLAPWIVQAQPGATWSHAVELRAPGDAVLHVRSNATGLDARAIALPGTWRNLSVLRGAAFDDASTHVHPTSDGVLALAYEVPLDATSTGFAAVGASRALLAPGETLGVLPPGWILVTNGLLLAAPLGEMGSELLGGRNATFLGASTADRVYLSRALPYLAAAHGGDPSPFTFVRAAVPRALSEPSGVVVPTDADAESLAEAVARAHQTYRVVEVAPRSAAWLAEGDARLHGVLSLVASGLRSAGEADEAVLRGRAVADPDATLPDAPAGSTLARQKGLVVTRALDTAIRNASGGQASLADLVARLEAEPAGTQRLDSRSVEALASSVANVSLAPFFEAYVYGSEWPSTASLPDAPDLFVTALRLAPAQAAPGETVTLSYDVVNRGTGAADLQLTLSLDGVVLRAIPTRLGVGERATLTASLSATEPGEHVVRLHHREATLRVLSPGRLEIARVTTTPTTPRAGGPFQLLVYLENEGEQRVSGVVEVSEGEHVLQRATRTTVEGNARHALTLPMKLDDAGLHVLRVELVAEDGVKVLDAEVRVEPDEEARDAPWPFALAILGALLAAFVRR